MSGSSFGPGISVYGRARANSLSVRISVDETSLGRMFIADENAVRLASEWAAVRIPMVIEKKPSLCRKFTFAAYQFVCPVDTSWSSAHAEEAQEDKWKK